MNVVVCLPGENYSGYFLNKWTIFINECFVKGINIYVSQRYSPNIYYVRNLCLGGNIKNGKNQIPFQGKIEYDYILWIDSDNPPCFESFLKLISNDKDICAGIYKMADGVRYATVKYWDTTKLLENGEMDFATDETFGSQENLEIVSYTGMGFMLVKRGVFEKMEYPWFKPLPIDLGNLRDFTTEDVYFCLTAQQLGFQIYIDKSVRIEHEKNVALL